MMELVNAMTKYEALKEKNGKLFKEAVKTLIKLLAPCIPHFAEELWEGLGNNTSIFKAEYPTFDPQKLVKDEIEYAVQINSKLKTRITLSKSLSKEQIEEIVLKDENVVTALNGATVKKVIVIPGRLVNIIA